MKISGWVKISDTRWEFCSKDTNHIGACGITSTNGLFNRYAATVLIRRITPHGDSDVVSESHSFTRKGSAIEWCVKKMEEVAASLDSGHVRGPQFQGGE